MIGKGAEKILLYLNPKNSYTFYYKAKLPAIIENAQNLFSFPKQVREATIFSIENSCVSQLTHNFFIVF